MRPNNDNYLEYAVFSGRLVVKDVNDESDQLTFENTKQINLNHFIGATIEIDQYTESGNTVLGRWEIPSTLHFSLVDAWFMSGISNADNPSFIEGVKGNKLQLKNFAYALSSGFGKYTENFNNWVRKKNIRTTSVSATIIGNLADEWIIFYARTTKTKGFKIKVEGLPDNKSITYKYFVTGDENVETRLFSIQSDGIYSLPEGEATTDTLVAGFYTSDKTLDGYMGLTITQLPSDYEGALVFDGVDDYAACDNLPILTDYTLICRRVIEETEGRNYSVASKCTANRNGAFTFEQKYDAIYGTHSFGLSTLYTPSLQDSVIFQSTKNYNGKVIVRGTEVDTDKLYIGCLRDAAQCMKGAVYYFALYNKSLTTEEIEAEKVKLAKIWGSRL